MLSKYLILHTYVSVAMHKKFGEHKISTRHKKVRVKLKYKPLSILSQTKQLSNMQNFHKALANIKSLHQNCRIAAQLRRTSYWYQDNKTSMQHFPFNNLKFSLSHFRGYQSAGAQHVFLHQRKFLLQRSTNKSSYFKGMNLEE